MFMFSIFFLNAACNYIEEHNYDHDVRESFNYWYKSVPHTMFSLLVAVSGGTDWIDVMEPVRNISVIYQAAFTLYVLFVVIGVLNVLTGVFLESATQFSDRDLTVQKEIDNLDSFVQEML